MVLEDNSEQKCYYNDAWLFAKAIKFVVRDVDNDETIIQYMEGSPIKLEISSDSHDKLVDHIDELEKEEWKENSLLSNGSRPLRPLKVPTE
jgi:hypothetical protein